MAFITFNSKKFKRNLDILNKLFTKNKISWGIVAKILNGNKLYLEEILKFKINQICDSRISNLRFIKEINPSVETIYIKPPSKNVIQNVIKFADISLNTDLNIIKMLSKEAINQNKKHKIIIMIEMGELREGIMRNNVIEFYDKVNNISNIEIVGIGTNLSCFNGILPNQDKLIQLDLYEQLIESKFSNKLQYVSGGSSVTIPLIYQKKLPKGINHFRVGETLFLGTNVYNDTVLEGFENNIFLLYSEIIELIEKPLLPDGVRGTNLEGQQVEFDDNLSVETSYRAIIDIGLIDIDSGHLYPTDQSCSIIGASSDMIVINLGNNKNKYKTGDLIEFKLDYLGIARIMHSRYIDKRII